MLTLYRGDPEADGVLVGYFDNVVDAQCAIHEDSRNHESGTNYYLVNDDDTKGKNR